MICLLTKSFFLCVGLEKFYSWEPILIMYSLFRSCAFEYTRSRSAYGMNVFLMITFYPLRIKKKRNVGVPRVSTKYCLYTVPCAGVMIVRFTVLKATNAQSFCLWSYPEVGENKFDWMHICIYMRHVVGTMCALSFKPLFFWRCVSFLIKFSISRRYLHFLFESPLHTS